MDSKKVIKAFGVLSVIIAMTSCKQEVKEKEDTLIDQSVIEVSEQKVSPSNKLLYQHIKNNNEFILKLDREGDSVIGTFDYHLNGRDRNSGTIKGEFKGDLLIADYLFMSEGVTSTRQIVFKVEDKALLEGYGDIEEKDGRVFFKDVNKLQYNPDFKLELVPQSGK